MKTFPSSVCAFVVALASLALTVGCSDQPSRPPANVDVNAAITQLKSPDVNTRVKAATDLAAAGPKAEPAIPALIEALKDSDPLVVRLSAYALGEIGPAAKEAIPALKAVMESGSREMFTSTMNAIRAIDPNALPAGTVPNVATPSGK
jgi:HEAT repeat protein